MSVSLLPEESDQSLAFLQFDEPHSSNDNDDAATDNNLEDENHSDPIKEDMDTDMNAVPFHTVSDDVVDPNVTDFHSEQEADSIEAVFEEAVMVHAENTEDMSQSNNLSVTETLRDTEEQQIFQNTEEAEIDSLVDLVRDVDIDMTVLNRGASEAVDDNANKDFDTFQDHQLNDVNLKQQQAPFNPLAAKLVSSFTVQTKKEKIAANRPKSASSVIDRLSKPKNTSDKIFDTSKSVVLSSEELVMAKINEEKKARAAKLAKSKKKASSRMNGNFFFMCPCIDLYYPSRCVC